MDQVCLCWKIACHYEEDFFFCYKRMQKSIRLKSNNFSIQMLLRNLIKRQNVVKVEGYFIFLNCFRLKLNWERAITQLCYNFKTC